MEEVINTRKGQITLIYEATDYKMTGQIFIFNSKVYQLIISYLMFSKFTPYIITF